MFMPSPGGRGRDDVGHTVLVFMPSPGGKG